MNDSSLNLISPPFTPFEYPTDEFAPPPPPKVYKPSKLEILWRKVCELVAKIWEKICFWKSDFLLSTSGRMELKRERLIWQTRAKGERQRRKIQRQDSKGPVIVHEPPADLPPQESPLSDMCTFFEKFSGILVNQCLYKEKIESKEKEGVKGTAHQWKEDIIDEIKQLPESVNALKIIPTILDKLFPSQNWHTNSSQPTQPPNFFPDASTFFNTFAQLLKKGKLNKYLEEIKKQINSTFEEDVQTILQKNTKTIALYLSSRLAELLKALPCSPPSKKDIKHIDAFIELLKTIVKHVEGWLKANETQKRREKQIPQSKNDAQLECKTPAQVEAKKEAREQLERVKECGSEENYLNEVFHGQFGEAKSEICHPVVKKCISSHDEAERSRLIEEYVEDLVEKLIPYFLPKQNIELPDGPKFEIDGIPIKLPENFEKISRQLENIFTLVIDTEYANGKKITYRDKENFKNDILCFAKTYALDRTHNLIKGAIKKGLIILIEKLSNKDCLDKLAADNIFPALIDKIFESWVRGTVEKNVSRVDQHFHEITKAKHAVFHTKKELITTLNDLLKEKPVDFQFTEQDIGQIAKDLSKDTSILKDPTKFKLRVKSRLSEKIGCKSKNFPLKENEIDQVSDLFYKIADAKSKAIRHKIDLHDKVYNYMKNRDNDFKLDEEGVDKKKFIELSKLVFSEIYHHLHMTFVRDKPEKVPKKSEINKELKNYFKPANVPDQPLYGDLVRNILDYATNGDIHMLVEKQGFVKGAATKVLVGAAKLTNNVFPSISQSCSSSMARITCSYDLLVSSSVEAASRTLLTEKEVYEVFLKPEPPPEEREKIRKQTRLTLEKNIRKISALTRDTLKLVPLIPTLSSEKITGLIRHLFDNLFSRPEINKSLLLNAFDVIDRNLSESAQSIK
ncbi:MAG: hypothetical protein K940chlam7_00682 [Chlamydiae bacterium]|nr:hypothetical protein [Chlamydiota bacterium]